MQKILTQLSRLYNSTIFISVAGVIGIIVLLVSSLIGEYREVHQQAQVEVENITRLMEEHVFATILKCDLITREIQRNVRPDDMRPAHGKTNVHKRQLHDLLKSQVESMPELAALQIANAQGNYIYSSLDTTPTINIADRDYFKHQNEDAKAGLFISPPLLSRTTGKWTISLSRRLNFEDGSFAGLINVILDLEYFQQFYRSLDMGAHGQVSLFDKELRLAARYPPSDKDMGKKFNLKAKPYIDSGIKHTIYSGKSTLDGVDRLTSYRQVGDLPLFVFAGIANDDYLAEWRRHIWQYSLGTIIFAMVVVGFGLLHRRAHRQIHQHAYFDTLTGLPNRRMLSDRLTMALVQAKRYKRSLALMFLDLDGFKTINDTLGHDMGDELLTEVAARLRKCVRAGDTIARQGGDEFVIVLAEISKPTDASLVAEKIKAALIEPIHLGNHALPITTSIGIAIYTSEYDDAMLELMKKADKAMYLAKAAGRNTYRFFENR